MIMIDIAMVRFHSVPCRCWNSVRPSVNVQSFWFCPRNSSGENRSFQL